jgi:glycosyltransferase involved in cell wall biosynthesis
MRIAIYQNLPSGGAKRALMEWIKRLSPQHEIDIFTLSEANHDFCDLRPWVRRYEVIDFETRPLFLPPLGRLNQGQRWRDLDDLDRIGQSIAEQINTAGYDVFFANPCYRTLIPAVLQYTTVPSVYYLHEPFGPSVVRNIPRPYHRTDGWREKSRRVDPFFRLYRSRLERIRLKAVENTGRFLANSTYTRDQMANDYGVDALICNYGVDTDSFQPSEQIEKTEAVLSVGSLSPRKGFDFLVESLAHLPQSKRPPLRLVCNFIEPQEHQYLTELAHKCNVHLDIVVDLDTSGLAKEYCQALLCVYSPIAEPLGLVPLEAMACGTPVVAVGEAGVSETVKSGETGLLVERDPIKFAAAVEQLLDDHSLRIQMGLTARRYVERMWSWDRSAAQLETHLMR